MSASAAANQDPYLEELAEEVTALFPPVRPLPGDRQRLRQGLVDTMRIRGTVRIAYSSGERRRAFVACATVGSLLAFFVLMVYLWYARCVRKPGHLMPQ